jgi:hypothetical protein
MKWTSFCFVLFSLFLVLSVNGKPKPVIVKSMTAGNVRIDTTITILKAEPGILHAQPTKGFRITFHWQAASIIKKYRIALHITDKDGKTVMKDDHDPLIPTFNWKGLIEYSRVVSLPVWEVVDKSTKDAVLPEGEYSVLAGLYDGITKQMEELNTGPGVTKAGEGLYKIATLKLDNNASIPGAGKKTLDLTGYHLTFHDEFDSLNVSANGPVGQGGTRWIAHTPWGGDFGDAVFTDPRPDFPFTVKDGILCIEARKEDGKWKGGLLSAVDRNGNGFKQKYGYFECRAKLPVGPGTWPAFWLMGTLNRWGGNGPRINPEVDILEHYGHWPNRFSYTLHLWGLGGPTSQHLGERIVVFGVEDDFHTYGMWIDEKFMILYFDGVEMYRRETPEGVKTPLYPLVNMALGPGWPLDKTPNPSRMLIDYVRIYEKDK